MKGEKCRCGKGFDTFQKVSKQKEKKRGRNGRLVRDKPWFFLDARFFGTFLCQKITDFFGEFFELV